MSDYQLLDQDNQSYTVQHPDGSSFQVAKSGLDPAAQSRIEALPKADLAWRDNAQLSNPTAPPPLNETQVSMNGPIASALLGGVGPASPAQSPANPSSVPGDGAPAQVATPSPSPGDLGGVLKDAMGTEQAGIMEGAKAKAQESDANYKILGSYVQQQQQQAQAYQDHIKQLDTEQNALSQGVMNQKIDPDRYWNNKSTGNKVMSTIGILLSGLGGGGANGSPNMAMEMLKRQQDLDIDAQKSELGKKQNLLSMNMQKYKNLDAAEAVTRLQQSAILQGQIAQTAAKAGTPEAIAQGKVLLGQLKMASLPYAQQLFKMQQEAPLSNGQGMKQVPVWMSGDKELASSLVYDPVGKSYYRANDADGAKQLNSSLSAYTPTMNILQQMQQIGTANPGGVSGETARSLRAQLTLNLNKLHDLKRLSEEDIKIIQEEADNPNNWGQLFTRGSRTNSLMKGVNDDVESMKKQYIPNYKGPSNYSSFQPLGAKS